MESKLPAVVQHRIDLEAKQYAFYNYVTAATPANFDNVSTWPEYAQVAYYSIKHYMLGDLTCWPYKELTLASEYATLKERCDKMEAALKSVMQFSKGNYPGVYLNVLFEECEQALKEGESNTPAPAKKIEYMPILSAELYELRAFSNVPVRVPMHLLDKDQAMANHGQTLQRLKERGGLSIKEALSLMTLKRWMHYKDMPMVKAIAMLNDLIANNKPH
jgi:hypothetical protein